MRTVRMPKSPSKRQGLKTATHNARKSATGRLEESKPNFQTIPVGTGDRKIIVDLDTTAIEVRSNALAGEHMDSFQSPESSNVVGASYSSLSQMLHINFKSGTYRYDNVPVHVWAMFKEAKSKGAFINAVFIGPDRKNPKYKGVKI
jgi:hypothetical protein